MQNNTAESQPQQKANGTSLSPQFKGLSDPEAITGHINQITKRPPAIPHAEVLNKILDDVTPVDFEAEANPEGKTNYYIKKEFYEVISADRIKKIANAKDRGLRASDGSVYIYNSEYWQRLSNDRFKHFLRKSAKKMHTSVYTSMDTAQHFRFIESLSKQLISVSTLPKPETDKDTVLINLQNGTFQITDGKTQLRPFNKSDFLTYQLPFKHNKGATAPIFEQYLNEVLPDKDSQKVLAEYTGLLFVKNGSNNLKMEKVLLLYGKGGNGKSVYFDVITALLGKENITHFTLEDLTDSKGYHLSKIENKLLNYASEISDKHNPDKFNALVSGEAITARPIYQEPRVIEHYAKLIFNCNKIPRAPETGTADAYYRRLLPIHFEQKIAKGKIDKKLSNKIISAELSGVFNWVLSGLERALEQGNFTECQKSQDLLDQHKLESDNVRMFLDDCNYQPSGIGITLLKDIYRLYKNYCEDYGYRACSNKNLSSRLLGAGYIKSDKRLPAGTAFHIEKKI